MTDFLFRDDPYRAATEAVVTASGAEGIEFVRAQRLVSTGAPGQPCSPSASIAPGGPQVPTRPRTGAAPLFGAARE